MWNVTITEHYTKIKLDIFSRCLELEIKLIGKVKTFLYSPEFKIKVTEENQ